MSDSEHGLADLPRELLVEELAPCVDLPALFVLNKTSRFFRSLFPISNPIKIGVLFSHAMKCGHIPFVDWVLEGGRDKDPTIEWKTGLTVAARNGHLPAFRY